MNTRLFRLCICTLALPLAVAACGGGSAKVSTSGTTATSTPAAGGGGATTSAFATCLKQHGVSLPDGLGGRGGGPGAGGPGGAGGGFPPGGSGAPGGFPGGGPGGGGGGLSSAQQAAFSACRSKLPAGGFGWWSRVRGWRERVPAEGVHVVPERQRREGADHARPGPAAGGSGRVASATRLRGCATIRTSPAASKKCAPLLPVRGSTDASNSAAG